MVSKGDPVLEEVKQLQATTSSCCELCSKFLTLDTNAMDAVKLAMTRASERFQTVLDTIEQALLDQQKKKKRHEDVYNCFTHGPDGRHTCVHCGAVYKWKTWNATHAREHIVRKCKAASLDLKTEVLASSQAAKRKKIACGYISAKGVSVSNEARVSVTPSSNTASLTGPLLFPEETKKKGAGDIRRYGGGVLTKEKGREIVKLSLETILTRFEPVTRLHDKFFMNEMVAKWGIGILKFIPQSVNAIFDHFINDMDAEVMEEICKQLRLMKGSLAMACDGVTVNGRSHCLFTVMKGEVALFFGMSQLREEVHRTDAEVDTAFQFLCRIRERFKCSIACVSVDNAATSMMEQATERYCKEFPEEPSIITNRDAAHCLDLIAKDTAVAPSLQAFMNEVTAMTNLSKTDRVDGIRRKWIENGTIRSGNTKIATISDTRFNKAGMLLLSIRKQREFLELCQVSLSSMDETNLFKEYYASRTNENKTKINKALSTVSFLFWKKVEFVGLWFEAIEKATKLVSREDFPLSAFLPLCHALRNKLKNVIHHYNDNGDCHFAGMGAFDPTNDLESIIVTRFNFDLDADRGTTKVGLLSDFHYWAFLADPFKYKLGKSMVFHGGIRKHLKAMVKFYMKHESEAKQDECYNEFVQYWTHQRDWRNYFDDPAPSVPTVGQAKREQETLDMDEVATWVTQTGATEERINFFSLIPPLAVVKKLLLPLLSLTSTGSIAVERNTKPLKHGVLTKLRSRLSPERADTLLRIGLNLKYLMTARADKRRGFHAAKEQAHRLEDEENSHSIDSSDFSSSFSLSS